MAEDSVVKYAPNNPCCSLWIEKHSKLQQSCAKLKQGRTALKQSIKILEEQIQLKETDNQNLKKAREEERARAENEREGKEKELGIRASLEVEISDLKSQILSLQQKAGSGIEDGNDEVIDLKNRISEAENESKRLNELLEKEKTRAIFHNNFPNGFFFNARLGTHPSRIWRSILHGRELLQTNSAYLFGNNLHFDIWRVPWIWNAGSSSLGHHYQHKPNIHVADLLTNNYKWNHQTISHFFTDDDYKKIINVPLPLHPKPPRWIWKSAIDGNFTVKSAYKSAHHLHLQHHLSCSASEVINPSIWPLIWKMKCLPKIKVFAWKCIRNCLPTCDNLFRRHCHADGACPLCFSEPETVEHLLFRCKSTAAVWKEINDFSPSPGEECTSLISWLNLAASGAECTNRFILMLGKFFTGCWYLWKRRNLWVFNSQKKNPCFWRADIIRDWEDYQKTCYISVISSATAPDPSPFNLPVIGYVVLCDGAFNIDTKRAAFAVLLFHNGVFLDGLAGLCPAVSAIEAESFAIRNSVTLATRLDLQNVWLGSDCKVAIDAINNNNPHWRIRFLIEDICSISDSFCCNFNFIPRHLNGVADFVAKSVLRGDLEHSWVSAPSVAICSRFPFAPP